MREFFIIAIFKIKADIRMNKTTLNSQKEKHSMLSLRRATDEGRNFLMGYFISIHALLAESDQEKNNGHETTPNISIHALLAESDPVVIGPHTAFWLFLSTLSLRRATHAPLRHRQQARYFYPRSPCGERLSVETFC